MAVILAFRRLRQEDCKLYVSLGYILRLCLKKIKERKKMLAGYRATGMLMHCWWECTGVQPFLKTV
jgi:hypothetical protein